MIVKVCGMRDSQNIREVESAEIDFMGFIFYDRSPRYVAEKPDYLPNGCKKIGVFVDASLSEILEICKEYGLDGVQLHGNESEEMCKALRGAGLIVIKAFGIAQDEGRMQEGVLAKIATYEDDCDFFLFDTASKAKGGTGKQFDWDCLDDYQGATPFLLSGGINPESLDRLRGLSHPRLAGIDLNSGFEIKPALKDASSIARFLHDFRKK